MCVFAISGFPRTIPVSYRTMSFMPVFHGSRNFCISMVQLVSPISFSRLFASRLGWATILQVRPQGDRPEVECIDDVNRDPGSSSRQPCCAPPSSLPPVLRSPYMLAIIVFHHRRKMISNRIHIAMSPAIPIEMDEMIVSPRGGV